MARASNTGLSALYSPGSPQAVSLLNRLLAQRGVDVKAADAVFQHEGLSGGIGDGGHAFGPGQENDAGGVWTGRYPGLSAQQKNAIAWSPSGLRELVDHVASVAGGLHGASAIQNIVTRFERPLNPGAEIQDALHHYGIADVGLPTVATSSAPPPPGPSPAAGSSGPTGPTGLERLLASTIGQTNQSLGLGGGGGLAALLLSHMGGR